MMFNEYVNHSNQCSNYYSVVRKEDVQMQQADTGRFKQKWMDVNQSYPQQVQTPQYHQKPAQQYAYDYNRQPNTPNHQTYEFIPKTNERSITPTVQQQQQPQAQPKQYYYPNSMPASRSYYANSYEYSYEQTTTTTTAAVAMSPANKFSKKISSSSLTNASQVDFGQAPTPSSSSTSSVLSPQPHTKIDSPKSWNTPVPTPLSVSQTTPPRNIQSSANPNEPQLNSSDTKSDQSSKSILSEININIDELFMYYPAVFEEIYYSLKLNSIEQIENDLRRYLEEQFKLNLSSNNSSSPVSANAASATSATNSAGIRI